MPPLLPIRCKGVAGASCCYFLRKRCQSWLAAPQSDLKLYMAWRIVEAVLIRRPILGLLGHWMVLSL